ncbi:MAG: hypothetical protein H6974_15610 [Gammaproteobacteria bacterium]|nr:hypothetical protein [Gammaproteobacteria bacterium]
MTTHAELLSRRAQAVARGVSSIHPIFPGCGWWYSASWRRSDRCRSPLGPCRSALGERGEIFDTASGIDPHGQVVYSRRILMSRI